ncbi:hypothetical protein [Polyangium sp. 6x1]|uniref:hypothetical protein n=1 Tax=Polyangium sp. 6x1 TaxID=3042689 RepID=UPI0024829A8F|nr:hypothetical protein [Polyangium sp. 6x1]MDI1451901.1 hypothetical protein [Polyangium sp. 6x1]
MKHPLRVLTLGTASLVLVGCGQDAPNDSTQLAQHNRPPPSGQGKLVWARAFGDAPGYQDGVAVAAGPNGEIALIARAAGTIDLGGGPLVLPIGGYGLYVVGLDPEGKYRFGMAFGDAWIGGPKAVAFTAEGGILLAGRVSPYADLGLPLPPGEEQSFVLALAPDGKPAWVRTFTTGYPKALALDRSGNIFLAGSFAGSFDLGTGPLVGAGNVFLAKLDARGQTLWSKAFPGMNPQSVRALAVDAAGDVVVAGSFYDTIDLGAGPLESAGDTDVFVAKYSGAGELRFGLRYGGPQHDVAPDVALDGRGDIHLAGVFRGTLDLPSAPLSAAKESLYWARLTPSGQGVYARAIPGDVAAPSLAVDPSGQARIAGSFSGSIDFGQGPLTAQGVDVFLAKLAPGGETLWAHGYGGDDETQRASALAVDALGHSLITGGFLGTLDFGGGPLVGSYPDDGFLAKISP